MPAFALGLYLPYLLATFGWRSWVQYRRTGSTGFHGIGGRPGSPEWSGGVLFAVAVVAGLAAPLLQLLGVLAPVALLDTITVHLVGLVLALLGIAGTVAAQQTMGDSWRVGVNPDEATRLVTDGIFALVRNPVFTAMLTAGVGLTLLAPNPLALATLATLVVAVEIQVRAVEEPYLLGTHGRRYRDYAARAGRFLPRVGRLRPSTAEPEPMR